MLIELLQNYGFSRNDAKVYLETLKFGEDTAGAIARRMGENRITVYSILKSLNLRGISREIEKNGVKFYSVISPEKLLKIHENKVVALKKSLPNFIQNIYPQMCKSSVGLYEGVLKVKEIYKDVLNSEGEILHIACTNPINEEIYQYLCNEYQDERILYKKNTRLIYNKKFSPYLCDNGLVKNETYKKTLGIDYSIGDSMSSIVLYGGNKVALVGAMGKNISGVVLENGNFYGILSGLFEMIWGAFNESVVVG